MPELPEVETVARGLARVMEGAHFARVQVNRPDLRFPFPEGFAQRLTGQGITSIARRAKYILAHLSEGDILLMHLGMSGRFLIHDAEGTARPGRFYHDAGGDEEAEPHAHVVFTLDDGTRIVYSDPRRFGLMDLFPRGRLTDHRLLRDIGIEPLGNELSGAFLNRALRTKQTPLKAALLDQKIVAGIGNIYACEALFRARLSPRRLARTLTSNAGTTERAERLAGAIRDVLGDAIAAGGSTLRDYVRTDGELGYFQHAFQVYDREGAPCPRPGCGGTVGRVVQANR
ncbi:MAG: bifunctional DNA-formamidopyrimidine glycosylase/DNA-(apurinic or apyrimidinic site) lyase, partial [Hyphomicrobiales bacterium]